LRTAQIEVINKRVSRYLGVTHVVIGDEVNVNAFVNKSF
jgi:hypothetical protein